MRIFKTNSLNQEIFVTPLSGNNYSVLEGDIYGDIRKTKRVVTLSEAQLKFPFSPSKIIGIGSNFPDKDITLKRNNPAIFSLPKSSIIDSNENINLTEYFSNAYIEGELALIVSKQIKHVKPELVKNYILGYSICNDISARDSSLDYVSNLVRKGADSFLPLGPCLFKTSAIKHFDINISINGVLKISSNTNNMLFSIEECISFISKFVTLDPGDVIALGAPLPKPIAYPGDTVEIEVPQIGTLKNKIVSKKVY